MSLLNYLRLKCKLMQTVRRNCNGQFMAGCFSKLPVLNVPLKLSGQYDKYLETFIN